MSCVRAGILGLLLAVFGCAGSPRADSTRPIDEREALRVELEKRVAENPSDVLSAMALGEVYEQLGQSGLAVHHYRRVVEILRPCVDTQPWLRLGRSLAAEGRLDEAETTLQKLLAVRPKTADGYWSNRDYREAHFLLGTIFERRHQIERMCSHYREFLRLGGNRARVAHAAEQLATVEAE